MSGPPPGNTLPAVAKPIIIETDGVLGELETGQIINAGGTSATTFTVNGVPVLTAGGGGSACVGFKFAQPTPLVTWNIDHGGGTLDAVVTIYDTTMTQILPNEVVIIDSNNVQVTFADAQAGIALIILFQ